MAIQLKNKELNQILNNPNVSDKVKRQILETNELEEKYLFLIEDYHPISSQDHLRLFKLVVLLVIIILIIIYFSV